MTTSEDRKALIIELRDKIKENLEKTAYKFSDDLNLNTRIEEDIKKRQKKYHPSTNPNGCGIIKHPADEIFKFLHLRILYPNDTKSNKTVFKVETDYFDSKPIACVAVDYPNYWVANGIFDPQRGDKIYEAHKKLGLLSLESYHALGTEVLIKSGDGLGVYIGKRDEKNEDEMGKIKHCKKEGARAFLDAVLEYKKKYQDPKIKKIYISTTDKYLKSKYDEILAYEEYKSIKDDIVIFETDKVSSDHYFMIKEVKEKHKNEKIGITIAPDKKNDFTNNAAGDSIALEELTARCFDMSYIGNEKFNKDFHKNNKEFIIAINKDGLVADSVNPIIEQNPIKTQQDPENSLTKIAPITDPLIYGVLLGSATAIGISGLVAVGAITAPATLTALGCIGTGILVGGAIGLGSKKSDSDNSIIPSLTIETSKIFKIKTDKSVLSV